MKPSPDHDLTTEGGPCERLQKPAWGTRISVDNDSYIFGERR